MDGLLINFFGLQFRWSAWKDMDSYTAEVSGEKKLIVEQQHKLFWWKRREVQIAEECLSV